MKIKKEAEQKVMQLWLIAGINHCRNVQQWKRIKVGVRENIR